MTNCERNI